MNLKEAEQCIKDVFGLESKLIVRDEPLINRKRVLRPATPEELAECKSNLRVLAGEKLVIIGEGKTWEDALRGPVSEEMQRRREEARIRAEMASHEGEMFATFLREKYDVEFVAWRSTSELGKSMQAAFDKRMKGEPDPKVPSA